MARDVKAHRGLTTERVVDAALRAADEGGIEAVSLRRLAGALEVTPMAIYRHVRNKSHLLDLMAERLLDQVDLTPVEAATWQDRLRGLLASFQAVAAAHPAAASLLSRPFVSPAALRVSEALLATLHGAGFDAGQSVRLLQVITGIVLGRPSIEPRGRRRRAIVRRTPTASRRPWNGCPLASSPTSRAPRTSSWIGPRGLTPTVSRSSSWSAVWRHSPRSRAEVGRRAR